MFIAGMVLFALASLAGGLADSEIQLIIARAVQGLGAALISPAALSIVTTTFAEGAERNKALGVWGAVAGSGGAAGVLLGGVLTRYAGWEWVLFVNVPIGLLAAFLAPRLLMESRDTRAKSFDAVGAVSVTAGLALLVYTLVDANNAGWGSGQTLALGGLAIVLLLFFVGWERRGTASPLVPFAIFRARTLLGSNAAGLLIGASLFSMFFFISLYLQQVLGYDALKAGFAYLPLALTIIVSAGAASVDGHADRLQGDAAARPRADHRRPRLVRAGQRARRDLRGRRAVPVADRRHGPGLQLRAGDDRRRDGRQRRRLRAWPRG